MNLGIGGQDGEGTLLKNGKAAAYDKTTGASFGLQAGGLGIQGNKITQITPK